MKDFNFNSRSLFYILKGKTPVPVSDFLEYAIYTERSVRTGKWRVSKTRIGKIMISTVFLGIDHGCRGETPVLFETMVFGGRSDMHQLRYTSWDAAKADHVRVVAIVRASIMCERLKKVFKCQQMKIGVIGEITLV